MSSGLTLSRRINKPVVWSICASISTMAWMPVSRTPCLGCNGGWASSWKRISGEALNSTQRSPSPLTAMEDWVRGLALISPARNRRQLSQLQFHWGNPPPAPDPNTRICINNLPTCWCFVFFPKMLASG